MGKIVLTPKLIVDREYTPAQRRFIDARLTKAEADIKASRVSKAFSNHSEFIADLHNAAGKLGARKTKRISGSMLALVIETGCRRSISFRHCSRFLASVTSSGGG